MNRLGFVICIILFVISCKNSKGLINKFNIDSEILDKNEIISIDLTGIEDSSKLKFIIGQISEGEFCNLSYLLIGGNINLETVLPESSNLKSIHIYSQGNIDSLSLKHIKNYKSLESISFVNCDMEFLPKVLSKTDVKKLMITGSPNLVSEYSFKVIRDIESLEFLHYGNCNLSSLSYDFSDNTNLTGLEFNNNKLSSLPDISESESLFYISLANNELTHYPLALTQLPIKKRLRIILFGNNIQNLPKEILQRKYYYFIMDEENLNDKSRKLLKRIDVTKISHKTSTQY